MSALTQARNLLQRARRVDPHAVDVLLALAFTAAALWTLSARVGREDLFRGDDFLGTGLVLLQTLPLAARRVAPLMALLVSVAAVAVHISLGYEGVAAGTFAALLILYSAASMTDMLRALLAAAITAAGIVIYFSVDRGEPGLAAAVTTSATYAAAWGFGVYTRSRREYTFVVEQKAGLLERERDLRAREAVADERARIARELHDMVGQALSLIVIQAGGAQRVLESRPEQARESLASIEATSRQALTDMERLLGMLRTPDDDATFSPQPGLGDIEALAARVSSTGLPVEVAIEGSPAPLSASVDLSAYRIIQEALTNVLKHAGPARARVKLRYAPDSIEIEVVDDGLGAVADGEHHHGGRGIIGMKERAALFGGDLTAGPAPEGGFRVHARLPLEGQRS